jgi:hypothetical protein
MVRATQDVAFTVYDVVNAVVLRAEVSVDTTNV